MARSDYAAMILKWASSNNFSIVDEGTGWPSIVEWNRNGESVRLALHLSPAGDYHRKPHEWRFQNPASGHPVDLSDGLPLLIGFDESASGPVLILTDGHSRVGRTTRFSVLFNKNVLQEARNQGLAKYVSTAPETMYAFRPQLIETVLELVLEDEELSSKELRDATFASGFADEQTNEAAERTRRAANVLVRDKKFGRAVCGAYNHQCAMCGLGINVVAGAHIYPVSAPNSPDIVGNGVSLCGNHHSSYDNFDIWFDSGNLEIQFSPRLVEASEGNAAVKHFIDQTFNSLAAPVKQSDRPLQEWIVARKEFYADKYDWVRA